MNKNKQRRLGLEVLESRTVPAAFGIPWHDPTYLSLSFAPDESPIAGHASELFAALDSQQPTSGWQKTVLAAFQSWAEYANLDFGIRQDGGEAFGAPGLAQGDPRFGDIRIGAQAMSQEALAIAVPPDPTLSGTLAGDVLLNSQYEFDGDPYSLLAVMLHEAGHSLGLANSQSTASVMFTRYNNSRETLSSEDITRIQALYGKRAADTYEGVHGNNSLARAASFRQPTGFKGETPLVAFGDITKRTDVDFFAFRMSDDGNDDVLDRSVTVRLQTEGSSLLAPKITILDQNGRRLGGKTSASFSGDVLQLSLAGLSSQQKYYVKVEGAQRNVFGVGRYGLSVRFDKTSSTADQVIDQLLSGPFDQLGANAIDAFFRTNGDTLFNADNGTNDRVGTASPLVASRGYTAGTRFEAVASLGKQEDLDFYRLVAPTGTARVLTASVWTTSQEGFQPKLTVVDSLGREVPATILVQGNGTSTVQVTNTVAGRAYFLKVEVSRQSSQDKGNYYVSANFGKLATPLATFATGTLNQQVRFRTHRLYIAQPQLMQFVLAAGKQDLAASVRLTITGGNGQVISLTSLAGETTSSGSVLLTPGPYTVRLEAVNPSGPHFTFRLRGNSESDPIGPVIADPTLSPAYTAPGSSNPKLPPPAPFVYPGLPVPFDPTLLPGYVDPRRPSTWPMGYVPPPSHFKYPWLVFSAKSYYFLPMK